MSILTTHTQPRLPRVRTFKRAFTLLELLVVIAIIGLLIGILLPTLSGARQAGMTSSTQSMINEFTNASSSFSNDHGSEMPGYYSPTEMGSTDNLENAKMSAMENAMLDLGGTDLILGFRGDTGVPTVDVASGFIEIAPFVGDQNKEPLIVNFNLMGATGAYFAPDEKFYRTMDPVSQQQGDSGNSGQNFMPDVVDAFGNPLLVWVKDETARGSINPDDPGGEDAIYRQFAQVTSDVAGAPAWFYLASNQTFFGDNAVSVGDSGRYQAEFSGIGLRNGIIRPAAAVIDVEDRIHTLATLLASPSYYVLETGETLGDLTVVSGVDADNIYPAKPRGRLIVQSAGADGYYFGTSDSGWRTNSRADGGSFKLVFGNNYKLHNGTRMLDEDGKAIVGDIASDFDDVLGTIN
ncbi:hypothetical protein COB72_07300 [bacterium]|nr:MAG: hypothetical protein COB72_07300 [bacterium]